jgi:hypothetical protein
LKLIYNCTVIDQAGNSAFDVVEVKVITTHHTSTPTTIPTTDVSGAVEVTPGYKFVMILTVIIFNIFLRRKR